MWMFYFDNADLCDEVAYMILIHFSLQAATLFYIGEVQVHRVSKRIRDIHWARTHLSRDRDSDRPSVPGYQEYGRFRNLGRFIED